ncbi:MAG: WYL domain-containing protein [Acidobacteria bacterium]|nr:WYL domain-containing protein [Acidobacteriota bacterium]
MKKPIQKSSAEPSAPRRIHKYAFARLTRICAEIQRGGYPTKADLARLTHRTPRTVQSDLRALENDWDAPLAFDREQNGFYFTQPDWRLPRVNLTEGELLSFFTAERLLRRVADVTEIRLVRSALRNLAALLPEEVNVDLTALEQAISFAPEPAADVSPQTLRQLAEAATHRETLRIEYFSPHKNERTEREVNILIVHNWMGEWYAIGWDVAKQDYRDFHAGRILKLTRTQRSFTPPPDWHPQSYLKPGFGMFRGGAPVTVVVDFDAYQARYARERSYHDTQQREELPEGGLRLTFETTDAALAQVARWVMQFGAHAEVIEPATLRQMVRKEIKQMQELYSHKPSGYPEG